MKKRIGNLGFQWVFGLFFFFLLNQSLAAETNFNRIEVDPEFRTIPLWYWQSTNSKCVPVPTYDVILRIGPQAIREEGFSAKTECELKAMPRRLEAVLQCDGKVIEVYYSKEKMCQDHLKSVASNRNAKKH